MGRPSKYKAEYAEQAFKLCLLGATDKELADFFETTEQTINAWKKNHKEFFESLKRGKYQADSEVAQKLFHRAKGYSHPEDKIFNNDGMPLIVPTIKHYPPDTTAAIFWLKNRQSKKWRDKQDIQHSGETTNNVNMTALTVEELRKLASLDDGNEKGNSEKG